MFLVDHLGGMAVSLAAVGLIFDVIGALAIAIPDFPRIRRLLPSGRLEVGLSKMESTGIAPNEAGYDILADNLEQIYQIQVPGEIQGIRVGNSVMSKFGRQEAYIVYQNDEAEAMSDISDATDLSYRQARQRLENVVQGHQARVQGVGFGLLISGFSLQAIALM